MMTAHSEPGMPDPPPAVAVVAESTALDNAALREKIALLEQQLALSHNVVLEHADLTNMVGRLREANENLLLATVNSQTLQEEAVGTNTRQNEFLAMLAHELRNPLAPISMASNMLAKMAGASPELIKLQSIIERQVTHLSRLLDDLLDAARINSGKISLVRKPLKLVELITGAVETVQERLLSRSQQLELDMPAEIMVDGDQVRLAQVFSNLLVNASKFTQDGGKIRVAARAHEGVAVVTVTDNGVGIAPDVIGHIFSLFTQGPRTLARLEGGLGVGLNVVSNIVRLHGGSVKAASDGVGCGSGFTVTLPVCAAPQQETTTPAPSGGCATPRRILLIEDNIDANDTLRMLLSLEGHQVTSAFDGIAGLSLASTQSFDVLVCDIGLPGMDGLELIGRLRRSPGLHIPFAIAISGYGQAEDRERAIGAGFGYYFVKPVDMAALLALVASDAVSRFIVASKRRQGF